MGGASARQTGTFSPAARRSTTGTAPIFLPMERVEAREVPVKTEDVADYPDSTGSCRR
jgi:hypothetical protein